jgi:hypothetical protein
MNVEDVFLGVAWGRNPRTGTAKTEIRVTNEPPSPVCFAATLSRCGRRGLNIL